MTDWLGKSAYPEESIKDKPVNTSQHKYISPFLPQFVGKKALLNNEVTRLRMLLVLRLGSG